MANALEIAYADLEQKVTERTTKLKQAVEQLQRTQAQMIQAEKMSSLGQLVAGVAHEINNPINFIHGNLRHVREYSHDLMYLIQLYQQSYPQPNTEIATQVKLIDLKFIQADLPQLLSSMEMGTDRICQIVLSLRNFSRLNEAEFKTVDIHEGIDSTLLILQHRLKAHAQYPAIEVIKDYGNLPAISCYPGQLNQVFMNILTNAIDALEEFNIQRTEQEIQINPSQIIICTSVVESKWVEIAIADNGMGMPEAVQDRIFDPFFTTKPVGKGTGIGMSISYQIIEKHHGSLHCCSTPNQGAEFKIRIPIEQLQHSNPK
ncbi:MAG: HAMP domain-containing histidine kinase [Synechococcales cyanobacterium CRU_2_2]|nr:HAMP domain-containing histidine kinase [Synechococcales cyanobacterium CRU_2_2]